MSPVWKFVRIVFMRFGDQYPTSPFYRVKFAIEISHAAEVADLVTLRPEQPKLEEDRNPYTVRGYFAQDVVPDKRRLGRGTVKL